MMSFHDAFEKYIKNQKVGGLTNHVEGYATYEGIFTENCCELTHL